MRLLRYIPFDADDLIPKPEFFTIHSDLHGRMHVARVIVLGAKLLNLVDEPEYATPLWAASYIHDLGRVHDGYCEQHGTWSAEKVEGSGELKAILSRGGMRSEHWPMVKTAVIHHCKSHELTERDENFRLTHLLKDADGLDRVRLGDLNPKYLRTPQAHDLVNFAQSLFDFTTNNCDSSDPHLMSHILTNFH